MKRRLFNLLTALSLLICVTTALFWARSFWRSDQIQRGDHLRISSTVNRIFVFYSSNQFPSHISYLSAPANSKVGRAFGPFWGITKPAIVGEPRYGALGFFYCSYLRTNAQSPTQLTLIVIPFWFIFALFAVLPSIWLVRRREPHNPGLCPTCGYDLRATPHRCPECGTASRIAV